MRIAPPTTILVALLIGCALPYLAGGAVALEAVLMQQAYSLEMVREAVSLRFLVLYLPMLSLSTLVLTYLLGRVAFSTSARPHPADVAALILPLVLQGVWFEHALNPAPVPQVLWSLIGTPLQALSWLAIVLVAVLAFLQARRAKGAA